MRFADLCSGPDPAILALAFVERVLPEVSGHDEESARALGWDDCWLWVAYGAKELYRAGKYVFKLDANKERWIQRENHTLRGFSDLEGVARWRYVEALKVKLLVRPWVERVPPAPRHVDHFAKIVERLSAEGVELRDDPYRTVHGREDGSVLVVDFGRFARSGRDRASWANGQRLVEFARNAVEVGGRLETPMEAQA